MSDVNVTRDLRRAELARVRLARDLSSVVQTGNRLIERGKSLVRKAVPIAIAIGLLGLLLAASVASRRRRRSFIPPRKPSFFTELLRRAVLAAAATLAGRLARRLPVPRLVEARPLPELPGALFDPMLQDLKAGRRPGQRRARV